jgi:uncharacterized protein YjiS (DUF1127 family)
MSALDFFLDAPAQAPDRKGVLTTWRGRVRCRHELWRLLKDKPELLTDIGLTVEVARAECDKPFWRAFGPFPTQVIRQG